MKHVKDFAAEEFPSIKGILYHSAEVFGEKPAFILKEKKEGAVQYHNISYRALLDEVNAFGTALYAMGLAGKRIAVVGKNRYEWILTYLSGLLGGIVTVPLDKDLQPDEMESSIMRSKADAIVFDGKHTERIEKIKERGRTSLSVYICMDPTDAYKTVSELKKQGKEILAGGDTAYIDHTVDADCMSLLLFTSGTTSQSKAVMLSQRNIASNIYALQCVEDIRSTDTNIAFLPLHHIFGSTCLLMMLAIGVTTAFPDGLRYIKQNLQEYKVSIFVGVPILIKAIYKAIQKAIKKQGKTKLVNAMVKVSNVLLKLHIDVRRRLFKKILAELGGELRLIVSGGAPADLYAMRGFTALGVETVQGYGLSETAPVIAAESYYVRKPGSVGFCMINDDIEIVDPDEAGIGEIRVKGPNVMLGYYEMPELTKEVLRDGWFYTGDLGYFDKKGYLYITGRNKNMIVLKNGKKIFPEEVEAVVSRIDLVGECMVFGVPDIRDKTDIKVAVKVVYDEEAVRESYAGKTENELREILWEKLRAVNETFPRYKYIQKLVVSHEELIKTTTKKVKRQEEMLRIQENMTEGDYLYSGKR